MDLDVAEVCHVALKKLKTKATVSPMDVAFTDFLSYLRSQNYSPATIDSYNADYRTCKRFIEANYEVEWGALELADIDVDVMTDFMCWMTDELK